MENHTIVTLKKGEGRTIKAGGLWIFDNEIDTITGTFKNGDVLAYLYKELKEFMKDASTFANLGFLDTIGV